MQHRHCRIVVLEGTALHGGAAAGSGGKLKPSPLSGVKKSPSLFGIYRLGRIPLRGNQIFCSFAVPRRGNGTQTRCFVGFFFFFFTSRPATFRSVTVSGFRPRICAYLSVHSRCPLGEPVGGGRLPGRRGVTAAGTTGRRCLPRRAAEPPHKESLHEQSPHELPSPPKPGTNGLRQPLGTSHRGRVGRRAHTHPPTTFAPHRPLPALD